MRVFKTHPWSVTKPPTVFTGPFHHGVENILEVKRRVKNLKQKVKGVLLNVVRGLLHK